MNEPRVRPGPREALDLLRRMGPRWTFARALHGVRVRSGAWGRRFPSRPLDAWTLSSVARGFAPTDLRAAVKVSTAALPGGRRDESFDASLRDMLGPMGLVALCDESAAITAGRQRFFGGPEVDVGFPPRWRRHPVTGVDMQPQPWNRVSDLGGVDIKPLWEPARFRAAFVLARTWRATGEAVVAEALWALVDDFLAENPPGTGPHWMCGQETALRAASWCFALGATLDAPALHEERLRRVTVALAAHGERIEATHDFALLQRNNHGLNEALGLLLIAATLPFLDAAPRWDALARRTLDAESARQVETDGSYVQNSLGYHRVAVECLAWACAAAEGTGRPLPRAVVERLARLATFLAEVTDPSTGAMPAAGSADGSRVFVLDTLSGSDLRGTLAAGRALGGGRRIAVPVAAEEPLLWLRGAPPEGDAAPHVHAGLAADVGGWHTLRAGASWGLFRCGPLRHRPAQSDMLHLSILWKGHEVLGDPGTFSYDAPPPFDNGLAAARVHNVPRVGGVDPMVRGPRFLWFRWCEGRVLDRGAAEGAASWITGEHRGYARRGVVVRRTVVALGRGLWIVMDDLLGRGDASADAAWLFPRARIERRDGAVFGLATPAGPLVAAFASAGADGSMRPLTLEVVEGDTQEARGWWSPGYGSREAAPCLVITDDGPLPRRRLAVIDCGSGASLGHVGPERVDVRLPEGAFSVRWAPPGAERGVEAVHRSGAEGPP